LNASFNIGVSNYILAGISNKCIYFLIINVGVLITPTFIIEPFNIVRGAIVILNARWRENEYFY